MNVYYEKDALQIAVDRVRQKTGAAITSGVTVAEEQVGAPIFIRTTRGNFIVGV